MRHFRFRAFTLVELLIVIIIIAVLAAIAIPKFAEQASKANAATCRAHLRLIDHAKEKWASAHDKKSADIPTWLDLVGQGLYLAEELKCPTDGEYTIGEVGEEPTCSVSNHHL